MADNINVRDAAAITRTLRTTDAAGIHTPHHNVDNWAHTAVGAPVAEKAVPTVAAETIGGVQTCSRGVFVQAIDTNTDPVYVGGAAVTVANGIKLAPADCVWVPVDNVADVWCISAVVAQKLRVMGV